MDAQVRRIIVKIHNCLSQLRGTGLSDIDYTLCSYFNKSITGTDVFDRFWLFLATCTHIKAS